MYQSVLVPLDGSKFAEQALPLAISISRGASARLQVASAVSHTALPMGTTPQELDPHLEEWYTEYLAAVRDRLGAGSGLEIETHILHGVPADALAEFAARSTDLIVMTTHGRQGVSQAWLGSVADRLARHCSVPMLLLRPSEDRDTVLRDADRIRRILVPLDGSDLAESAIPAAVRLAAVTDASFLLLRVVPARHLPGSPYLPHTIEINREEAETRRAEAASYLEQVAERLWDEVERPVETRVAADGYTPRVILEIARDAGCGVIAIATHGRGGFRRAVLGSVADKVIRGSEVPVLLVRASEDQDD